MESHKIPWFQSPPTSLFCLNVEDVASQLIDLNDLKVFFVALFSLLPHIRNIFFKEIHTLKATRPTTKTPGTHATKPWTGEQLAWERWGRKGWVERARKTCALSRTCPHKTMHMFSQKKKKQTYV